MEIGAFILAIVTAILGTATVVLARQKSAVERSLEKYRAHVKSVTQTEVSHIDVIVLGPRYSGKTSIIDLWTKPWAVIHTIQPSTKWRLVERDVHKLASIERYDSALDIQRTFAPTLRMRVHDYPGEDNYRTQAVEDIKKLGKKVVVLLVLKVGYVSGSIEGATDNASYFSTLFVGVRGISCTTRK